LGGYITGLQRVLFRQDKEWSWEIFAGNDVCLWDITLALCASEHYLSLKTLLLNWYIGRIPGGIILILVPACYSIFLIGKGYFKEGGEKASFKWKLKMMVSVFLNSFLALFGLMFFSFLQRGGSFSELVALIQEAALSINWSWMLDFVACCGLIVLIVWLDHKKHSSKSKHKG